MWSRRGLLGATVSVSAISGRAQAAAVPEAPTTTATAMQPPLFPPDGPGYRPVVTLNGWTLPWRMNGDWKEFHLLAEPVVREFAPGMNAYLWGYNGQAPGPTIEAVEGDKVRFFVTNRLPEHTTVHWHGMLLPNGMDGVGGVRSRTSIRARPLSTSSRSSAAARSASSGRSKWAECLHS
jgi:manganese oxidase